MASIAVGSAISGAIGALAGVLGSRSGCCGPLPLKPVVKEAEAKQAEAETLPFKTPAKNGRHDALVVVDPLSTGARLAYEATKRGYKVIRILSPNLPTKVADMIPQACRGLNFEATLFFDEENPKKTVDELMALNYNIVAVQPGCESGVEAYDALIDGMTGYPSNGLELSSSRRDKYLMGECVRQAKIRAVKQIEVSSWGEETVSFLSADLKVREGDESGPWCVLKPTKSAGSDGVYIAKTMEQACEAFQRILGSADVFGQTNQTVLVQEFLKGKEYIIDSVSMEGEHKCVAIWEYDKRPTNGAQFVYYGARLYQSADGYRERKMVEYMHSVLTALGVRHGPTHGEVMWSEETDEPCLVEVGARPHGAEGTFVDMVESVIGYSQVSVMLDTFDKPVRFKRLPVMPLRFDGLSISVDLVSKLEGTLEAYPLLEQVKQLRSYKSHEIKVPIGGKVEKTIDLLTSPGSVELVHADGAVAEEDARWIISKMLDGSFYKLVDSDAMLKLVSPNFKTL